MQNLEVSTSKDDTLYYGVTYKKGESPAVSDPDKAGTHDDTITVINTVKDRSLKVEKKWDDSLSHAAEEVKVELYRWTDENTFTPPTGAAHIDTDATSASTPQGDQSTMTLKVIVDDSGIPSDRYTWECIVKDLHTQNWSRVPDSDLNAKNDNDNSFSTVPAEKYTPSENIYVSGERKYKPLDGDGTTAWTLTITNVKTAVDGLDFTQEITIEVIYNAHLNTSAPVLKVTGNNASKNTSYITYSNNPNANTKGQSSEDHVWVFTYEVDNIKVDGANKTDVTTTADATLKAAIDRVDDGSTYTHTDGKVYIKEGSNYYELPPFAGVGFTLKNSDGSTVNLIWDNTKEAYRPATAEEAAASGYSAVITSRATTGKFNIIGLDAGTYTLEETTVPSGYNKAQNITVTIGAAHKENDNQITANATLTNTNTNNAIVNNKGNQLPSTGGIGTTLFYVFGSMLVIAAGVYFVTKKRADID